jgi:hypothetical protein
LARAALALAKLTRLDPGRPSWQIDREQVSGRRFSFGIRKRLPSWIQRMQVLRMLLEREPEVGWQLARVASPAISRLEFSTRAKPPWRDWAPERDTSPTVGDHIAQITELVSQMLALTGNSGERWKDLVAGLPDLPRDVHDSVVGTMGDCQPGRLHGRGSVTNMERAS